MSIYQCTILIIFIIKWAIIPTSFDILTAIYENMDIIREYVYMSVQQSLRIDSIYGYTSIQKFLPFLYKMA